ncbi:GvpL/GvpF family gas vesicle protein [Nocardia farcinica]|uniref:GvpL/GvpF family gas vesicle protein n=1 Tax=Nocardia farcinica TaxID=37329 RepID=UPI0024541BC8|nr:GvpL/GvpF family gas vesicle protein [Nocardia farcinica]
MPGPTAVYVYGIVPGDVVPEEHARGVGDPPCEVRVVRHGEVAALVSEVPVERPLGTPDDLTAHARLLDGSAAVAPVLPLRFGAVLTDADAVAKELLASHEQTLRAALAELEGRAQFVVKGRYVEQAILRELLDSDPQARRLREAIRDAPEDATRNERIALGELINAAIEQRRAEDTDRVVAALHALDPLVNPRPPTHEEDAAHVAVLIDLARQEELEQALAELARDWQGRVDLSLLGPMAAYDFVASPEPEG